MALYNRSDMIFQNYSWTTYGSDNPKITGIPDSTFLNRTEGYEILYFISKLMEIWGLHSIKHGNKMEEMIRKKVPGNLHSQNHIMEWINSNWDV